MWRSSGWPRLHALHQFNFFFFFWRGITAKLTPKWNFFPASKDSLSIPHTPTICAFLCVYYRHKYIKNNNIPSAPNIDCSDLNRVWYARPLSTAKKILIYSMDKNINITSSSSFHHFLSSHHSSQRCCLCLCVFCCVVCLYVFARKET